MSYALSGRPTFDDRDAAILHQRLIKWALREGPRVGDYIQMQDGSLRRFTHRWPTGLQVTDLKYRGSFHLCEDGHLDYSGALDPTIPWARIELTAEHKDGPCWFFHHGEQRAFNGVDANVPSRVYRELP